MTPIVAEDARREQAMKMIAKANRIRYAAAEAKREIASGSLLIQDALSDRRLRNERLINVLRAQPRWGWTKAAKLLNRLGCAPTVERKRIRELTSRQKERLLKLVADPNLDYRGRGFWEE